MKGKRFNFVLPSKMEIALKNLQIEIYRKSKIMPSIASLVKEGICLKLKKTMRDFKNHNYKELK